MTPTGTVTEFPIPDAGQLSGCHHRRARRQPVVHRARRPQHRAHHADRHHHRVRHPVGARDLTPSPPAPMATCGSPSPAASTPSAAARRRAASPSIRSRRPTSRSEMGITVGPDKKPLVRRERDQQGREDRDERARSPNTRYRQAARRFGIAAGPGRPASGCTGGENQQDRPGSPPPEPITEYAAGFVDRCFSPYRRRHRTATCGSAASTKSPRSSAKPAKTQQHTPGKWGASNGPPPTPPTSRHH